MTKRKKKSVVDYPKDTINLPKTTLSALRQDTDLWYRMQVVLYDLSNVGSDPLSAKRISSTTHPLYISEPYFTASEATAICTALIDDPVEAETADTQDASNSEDTPALSGGLTAEEAIHKRLINFFEKRKASGDYRPCGPHDMFPVYAGIFGIQKGELNEERFLSRLKRSGLGPR